MPHRHNKNCLEQFYEAYPRANWDYTQLLINPNLTVGLFKKFPKHEQRLEIINDGNFKALSLEWFRAFKDFNWNKLSRGSNLSDSWLEHFGADPTLWDFERLSWNDKLTSGWFDLFPDADWNYKILSSVGKITPEWFKKLENYSPKWDFKKLSHNQSLTVEWLYTYPEADWDVTELSQNLAITAECFEWAQEFKPQRTGLKMWALSSNPSLRCDWFEWFPYQSDWYFTKLSSNPGLSSEWFEKFPNANWVVKSLSGNLAITPEWFKFKQFRGHWNCGELSGNMSLTVDWLRFLPDGNWDYTRLSGHHNITDEWYTVLPQCKWSFGVLSRNHYITSEWFKRFPHGEWSVSSLAHNIGIAADWFDYFPELVEYPDALSRNHGIGKCIRGLRLNVNWNYYLLSENQGLTTDWLLPTPVASDWDFERLSKNWFMWAWDGTQNRYMEYKTKRSKLPLPSKFCFHWRFTPVTRDSKCCLNLEVTVG